MEIKITARHMELTEEMKGFIEEKLGRLERHLQEESPVSLVISEEKPGYIVEISLHDRGSDFLSKASRPELESATEEAVDKMNKQLRRHKDKLISSARTSPGKEIPLVSETGMEEEDL